MKIVNTKTGKVERTHEMIRYWATMRGMTMLKAAQRLIKGQPDWRIEA